MSDVHDWLAARSERVIETSCAWVFLAGETALKLKKPVDYGFLDFSTPAKRRWALERELAFNQATAPHIYRRVRAVTRAPDGSLALDGGGEPIDCVLEMRAFDPDAVLAEHPERVDGDLAERLGRAIARLQSRAAIRPEGGGVNALGFTLRTNAENFRLKADLLGEAEVEALIAATDAAFAAAGPLLEARRTQGFARHCHGDLHLGNILLEGGQPVPFDCIEFNDLLSEIDVLYDVAFLIMDLAFRGRAEAASRAFNGYLDEAARRFPPALWDGLAALPLFLSARAGVRAHVTAYQGDPAVARAYLAAARAHLAAPAPTLTAIGGLSGTGKTTLARKAAPLIGGAPGAVVLRTDEIRKRLLGLEPHQPAPAASYTPQVSDRVYGELLAVARQVLGAGRAVVLDAVFLRPHERDAAEALARAAGVPFRGAWLQGRPDALRARLAARAHDASDAGPATLDAQLGRDPGPITWPVLDADRLDANAAALAEAAA